MGEHPAPDDPAPDVATLLNRAAGPPASYRSKGTVQAHPAPDDLSDAELDEMQQALTELVPDSPMIPLIAEVRRRRDETAAIRALHFGQRTDIPEHDARWFLLGQNAAWRAVLRILDGGA